MSRSFRTKQGLAAAKARGVKLGGSRANAPDIRQYQAAGTKAAASRAAKFAEAVRPLIEEGRKHLRAEGRSAGLDAIADELNRREIPSARGRRWSGQAIKNVLARARDDHQ